MPDKDKISESTTGAELAAFVWKHSVMDRLLSFCSTGDIQGLDQAKWICERHPVNYSKIKAWAKRDGRANDNEFKKICEACEKGIKVFVVRGPI